MLKVAICVAVLLGCINAEKPNIVVLIADDLGYSTVGFRNSEAITPNLDRMAAEGLILDHHYAYKYCSPSRSSFFSGRLPVHVNQENWPPNTKGGGVPLEMTILPELMKRGGYSTHLIGKWSFRHCGASSTPRLPINRGFDSHFGLLGGAAAYYDQARTSSCGSAIDLWRNDRPAWGEDSTEYSTFQYTKEALSILDAHDKEDPLFMVLSYQSVHGPLEVPKSYEDKFASVEHKPRRKGLAMANCLDESVGIVEDKLKETNMWNNTLVVFFSDNGGVRSHTTNFPLRGAKGSDFEGGVKVITLLDGGYLPESSKKQTMTGLVHIADWYATFAALGGLVDFKDYKAAEANFPAIDSMNMWPMLSGQTRASPRTELMLSGGPNVQGSGLIQNRFKLLRGRQRGPLYPGPFMPNATQNAEYDTMICEPGCLFDIYLDPQERNDLRLILPATFESLMQRAAELEATAFQSGPFPQESPCVLVGEAVLAYGGYWGPFEDVKLDQVKSMVSRRLAAKPPCIEAFESKRKCKINCETNGMIFGSYESPPGFKCHECKCDCAPQPTAEQCEATCTSEGSFWDKTYATNEQGCRTCSCTTCPLQLTDEKCMDQCRGEDLVFNGFEVDPQSGCMQCACGCSVPVHTEASCTISCERKNLFFKSLYTRQNGCPNCACKCGAVPKPKVCRRQCASRQWAYVGLVLDENECMRCQCGCNPAPTTQQCKKQCLEQEFFLSTLPTLVQDGFGCTVCQCGSFRPPPQNP